MYSGSTVPVDRPARADEKTFEDFAQRPFWHAEEGAALVLGFTPRRGKLKYRPFDDKEHDRTPGAEKAVSWGQLFAGELGEILSRYSQAVESRGWDFRASYPYVAPAAFIEFCDRSGMQLPAGLRKAIRRSPPRSSMPTGSSRIKQKRRRASTIAKRKSSYAAQTHQVAVVLREANVKVSAAQLQELVEWQATLDRNVKQSTFQTYVRAWRRNGGTQKPMAKVLRDVLWPESGRPSEEQLAEQKMRMPIEYAEILSGKSLPKKFLK